MARNSAQVPLMKTFLYEHKAMSASKKFMFVINSSKIGIVCNANITYPTQLVNLNEGKKIFSIHPIAIQLISRNTFLAQHPHPHPHYIPMYEMDPSAINCLKCETTNKTNSNIKICPNHNNSFLVNQKMTFKRKEVKY